MSRKIFEIPVLIAAVFLAACASPASVPVATQGQEQPQSSVPTEEVMIAQPLWSAQTTAAVNASPIVAGDLVIVPTADGVIHAIDARSGKSVWSFSELKAWDASVNADSEKVCAGAEGKKVFCLDLKTGSLLWNVVLDLEVQSRIAFGSDLVFAPTTRAGTGMKNDFQGGASLVAIHAKTGEIAWQSLTENYILRRPVVNGNIVITGGAYQPEGKPDGEVSTRIYAFNINDGSMIWEYISDDGLVRWVDSADDLVFFSAATETVYALNLADGALLWKYGPGYWMQFPAIQGERIYFGSGDEIFHAFNVSTGQETWAQAINASSLNQVGRPFIRENTIWFNAVTGEIYGLSLETGERVAYFSTGHSARVGGTMFESFYIFGDPEGNVYAYDIE